MENTIRLQENFGKSSPNFPYSNLFVNPWIESNIKNEVSQQGTDAKIQAYLVEKATAGK